MHLPSKRIHEDLYMFHLIPTGFKLGVSPQTVAVQVNYPTRHEKYRTARVEMEETDNSIATDTLLPPDRLGRSDDGGCGHTFPMDPLPPSQKAIGPSWHLHK